jgi:hypothetical protein
MQSKFKSRQGSMKLNTLRKAMMAIGGITALVFIISLAAPKTTHAVIATFVQVVNTPSQPVPVANGTDAGGNLLPLQNRDIDNGPRHAVQFIGSGEILTGTTEGAGAIYQVPVGKRLVIEHASGEIYLSSNDSLMKVAITTEEFLAGSLIGLDNYFVPALVGTDANGAKRYAFSQSFRGFSDNGVALQLERNNSAAAKAVAHVTLQGLSRGLHWRLPASAIARAV